jgi:hypothetical protein
MKSFESILFFFFTIQEKNQSLTFTYKVKMNIDLLMMFLHVPTLRVNKSNEYVLSIRHGLIRCNDPF